MRKYLDESSRRTDQAAKISKKEISQSRTGEGTHGRVQILTK